MSASRNQSLSEAGKCLLLVSLLAKQKTISNNAKAFLKEMVLRRDTKLSTILSVFEKKTEPDLQFLEELHNLIRTESESTYNDLFTDTSLEIGKSLSKEERKDKQLNDNKSLTYGEVEYRSFYNILRKVQPIAGPTFYDLGSGTGKAVFAARLTCDYARCIGIEILQGLHDQAFKITERYNSEYRQLLDASQRQHAAVYTGSFLEFDWTDGDVVFANSTCFDDDLMAQMSRMAEGLKPGAVLVTFTKGLTYMDKFELLQKKREKMSWGPATVFIHRRLNHDGSPFGRPDCLNLLPSDSIEYIDQEPASSGSSSDSNDYSSSGSSDDEDDDTDDDDDDDDDDQSSSSSSTSDEEAVSPFTGGMDEYYSRGAQDIMDQYAKRSTVAQQYSNNDNTEEYKPQSRPGKLSIQPTGEVEVTSRSPFANPGFSSPHDSGLLRRKAARF